MISSIKRPEYVLQYLNVYFLLCILFFQDSILIDTKSYSFAFMFLFFLLIAFLTSRRYTLLAFLMPLPPGDCHTRWLQICSICWWFEICVVGIIKYNLLPFLLHAMVNIMTIFDPFAHLGSRAEIIYLTSVNMTVLLWQCIWRIIVPRSTFLWRQMWDGRQHSEQMLGIWNSRPLLCPLYTIVISYVVFLQMSPARMNNSWSFLLTAVLRSSMMPLEYVLIIIEENVRTCPKNLHMTMDTCFSCN